MTFIGQVSALTFLLFPPIVLFLTAQIHIVPWNESSTGYKTSTATKSEKSENQVPRDS